MTILPAFVSELVFVWISSTFLQSAMIIRTRTVAATWAWKLKSYFTTQGKMPQNLYHLNKKYSIKRKIPCHTKNLKSIITYKIHHGKIKDSKNKAESLQIAFKNGLRVQR